MKTGKMAIFIAYVTIASFALAGSPRDKLEPAAPLRTWIIGMSEKVTGWPLYKDGAFICVLMKDGTTNNLKMSRLCLADQRYLKKNPALAKAGFNPEAERVVLVGDIDELSNRLTAMEAAQKTGAFQANTRTVSTTVASKISKGSEIKGPSKTRITATRIVRGRKETPVDLDLQTSPKTNLFYEVTLATQTTASCVTSDGSYTDGPSLKRIKAVNAVLLERKAKLAALKAAYPMADVPPNKTE